MARKAGLGGGVRAFRGGGLDRLGRGRGGGGLGGRGSLMRGFGGGEAKRFAPPAGRVARIGMDSL